ncbi:MAG TPA: ECF-type sigma factor [Bryobacteraceae bacterium]|nr:ECF-type sigma factor [Bryobacteraceae bacterium]
MNADVPQLLEKLRAGEESALSALVAVLYDELRRIAARQLRAERPSHTLQPTALVHEAYLKLMGEAPLRFADRSHFLAVTSRVMRQVLVDYARARAAAKRGGDGRGVLPLADWTVSLEPARKSAMEPLELLDLDRAIEALAREDHTLAQLIEMRYFGGMTAEETAEALGQSVHVVRHDLRLAQAWLRRKIRGREAQA